MRISLDPIKTMLANRKPKDELEFRFARKSGTNLDQESFIKVYKALSSDVAAHKASTEDSKVQYYKGGIRKITYYNPQTKGVVKVQVMLKTRRDLQDVVFGENYTVRLGLSSETILENPEELQDKDRTEAKERIRKRASFEARDSLPARDRSYRIDMTFLDFPPTSYELEIEILKMGSPEDVLRPVRKIMALLGEKIDEAPAGNPGTDVCEFKGPVSPDWNIYNSFFRAEIKARAELKKEASAKEEKFLMFCKMFTFENKPRNLKRKHLQELRDYAVTNKANGIRRKLIIKTDTIFVVDQEGVKFLFRDDTPFEGICEDTLVDAELVDGKYHVFDALFVGKIDVRCRSFKERLAAFEKAYARLPASVKSKILVKQFFATGNILRDTKAGFALIESQPEEKNDGLIFMPIFYPYYDETRQPGQIYKWKPPAQITIDFRVKSRGREYELFVGSDQKEVSFWGSKKYPYKKRVQIPFEAVKKYEPIDGKVIEFKWGVNNFEFERMRTGVTDKDHPNSLKVAQDNWEDINEPITKEELLSSLAHMNNRDPELYREFHNNLKRLLICQFAQGKTLLDIGSGKGGDLPKYHRSNVKRMYLVEPDPSYIAEMQKRMLQSKTGGSTFNNDRFFIKNVVSIQAQGEDTEKIAQALQKDRIGKVDLVCSFFSLTHFFESEFSLDGLVRTISSFLPLGGFFIGTTLDGESMYQFLSGVPEYRSPDGLIWIKKEYTEDGLLGFNKRISIALESTKTVKESEYLVDFQLLVSKLEQKGFKLSESRFFEPYNLPPVQKEYSQLNRSFIFQRIATDFTASSGNILATVVRGKPGYVSPKILGLESIETLPFKMGGMEVVRKGVVSEGSCFVHSVLRGRDKAYLNLELSKELATARNAKDREQTAIKTKALDQFRREYAANVRARLASELSFERWLEIGKGLVAISEVSVRVPALLLSLYELPEEELTQTFQKISAGSYDSYASYRKMILQGVERELPPRDGMDFSIHLDQLEKELHREFKTKLSDCSTWIKQSMLEYIGDALDTDVYIVNSRTQQLYSLGDCQAYLKKRPSVLVYNIDQTHFELLGLRLPPETPDGIGKVKHLFDPDDPVIIECYQKLCPADLPVEVPEPPTETKAQQFRDARVSSGKLQYFFPQLKQAGQLFVDETALFSITRSDISQEMVASALVFFQEAKEPYHTAVDGTAGIGGDTFSLAAKFTRVLALEPNPTRHYFLQENLKLLKLTNVLTAQQSFLKLLETPVSGLLGDLIYLDPPWGGVDYKKEARVYLNLDSIPIETIINRSLPRTKLLVMKAPLNYELPAEGISASIILVQRLEKMQFFYFSSYFDTFAKTIKSTLQFLDLSQPGEPSPPVDMVDYLLPPVDSLSECLVDICVPFSSRLSQVSSDLKETETRVSGSLRSSPVVQELLEVYDPFSRVSFARTPELVTITHPAFAALEAYFDLFRLSPEADSALPPVTRVFDPDHLIASSETPAISDLTEFPMVVPSELQQYDLVLWETPIRDLRPLGLLRDREETLPLLTQILWGLKLLKPMGVLVLGVTSFFGNYTITLLGFLASCFKEVHLAHPPGGRQVNVVAKGYQPDPEIIQALTQLHRDLRKAKPAQQTTYEIPKFFVRSLEEAGLTIYRAELARASRYLAALEKSNLSLVLGQRQFNHVSAHNHWRAEFLPQGPIGILPAAVPNRLISILTPEFPRRAYVKESFNPKALHLGQRKLFLSEVEFLNGIVKSRQHPNYTLIYVGAAPGLHIPLLAEMFPEISFILYDPAPFQITSNDRIAIHRTLFTDDLLSQYEKLENLLFVSDIRSSPAPNASKKEVETKGELPAEVVAFEEEVEKNLAQQKKWVEALRPFRSLLKFRFPFSLEEKTSRYLKGVIHFQAYAPPQSAETRLEVYGEDLSEVEYNHRVYEEQLFYFNTIYRVRSFYEAAGEYGWSYDTAREFVILGDYLQLRGLAATMLPEFTAKLDSLTQESKSIGSLVAAYNSPALVESSVYVKFLNEPRSKGFQDLFKRKGLSDIYNKCLKAASDRELFAIIAKRLAERGASEEKKSGKAEGLRLRAKARLTEFGEVLTGYSPPEEGGYLDVGTGDGALAVEIAKGLDIPLESVYGVDITQPSPHDTSFGAQEKGSALIPGHFSFVEEQQPVLPFPDNHFALITCLQVLHHAKNPRALITEMKRVLKPGGALLLREHDLRTGVKDRLYLTKPGIDFEHILFILEEAPKEADYLKVIKNLYSEYHSSNEWRGMLGLPELKKTPPKGRTNTYTASYVKPLPKGNPQPSSGDSEEKTSIAKKTPFAYITLVMKGDSYVPGALVLGCSLRHSKTSHALICMVTADVSGKARQQLELVYDQVVEVPLLEFKCKPLRTVKQNELYSSWISASFTKWNCLKQTNYEKVLFLDSDLVVLQNLDELFTLPAPAGTFSSPWAAPYAGMSAKRDASRGDGIYNPYLGLKHGDKVSSSILRKGFYEKSFVCIGTSVLLAPSVEDFEYLIKMVKGREPFGFEDCNSGFDEQSIARLYYEKEVRWHHISQVYNFIPWHPEWLEDPKGGDDTRGSETKGTGTKDTPYLFHYFGSVDKPWKTDRRKWLDVEPWWIHARMVTQNPKYTGEERTLLESAFNAEYLTAEPRHECSYCKERESIGKTTLSSWKSHSLLSLKGEVVCPQF